MAITTLDTMIAGFNAQGWPLYKPGIVPQAAGCFTSLWTAAGIPGAGVVASSGVAGDVPTSATLGAIPFTNSGNTHIGRLHAFNSEISQVLLYDRLWQNSGLSPTTVGAQTVNSVALTRGPGAGTAGEAVEAWLQVYTVLGAGSTAKTITYTNSAGTASRTGTLVNFVTTAAVSRNFYFSLASGDTGVRSIQSFDNIATSTSGTFGLLLRRLVFTMNFATSNVGNTYDAIGMGLPRVYDSACLELMLLCNNTATQSFGGNIAFCQG